jgi:hypothetical protein
MLDMKTLTRAYGSDLLETVDGFLPKPIRGLDSMTLLQFVQSRTEAQLEALSAAIIRVHSSHADALVSMANTRTRDEFVVLDSALGSPHEPTVSKLMLYAEVIVCPDPLLEHPLALRQLIPDHFHSRWPYNLEQLQESLLEALDFYKHFAFPIREGILLPTAWHVAIALQNSVQGVFLGETASQARWDRMPGPIKDIAEKSFDIVPASFDGFHITTSSFDASPKSKTSQIAILAKGDPEFARTEMDFHQQVFARADESGARLAYFVQMPPETDERFDKWAAQARAKVVHNRMISLQSDLAFATRVNGSVITMSTTNQEILQALATDAPPTQLDAISAMTVANMELPLIENVSLNQLTRARQDTVALQNFRVHFRKACASIKSEVGSPKFKQDVDNIARDTVEQGIRELQQAYRSLRKKSVLDLALSTTFVMLSFSGVSLGQLQWLPALLGSFSQLRSFFEAVPKLDELRKNPMFMLWNMTRKPFQAGPLK